jgi:hypothetical protein
VLPCAKYLLRLALGSKRTDEICLRTWFLSVYNVYFYLVLVCYLIILMLTVRYYYKLYKSLRGS